MYDSSLLRDRNVIVNIRSFQERSFGIHNLKVAFRDSLKVKENFEFKCTLFLIPRDLQETLNADVSTSPWHSA